MPHRAAGMRTDPPVSLPRPPGATRAPMAAPVPLELPPAMRERSYGLRAPIGCAVKKPSL